jgi:CubicO group peptidase (beta-lactamase class C family)
MSKSFIKTSFLLVTFFSFFVACQTVTEQKAHGRPPLAPPDNKYSTVKLNISDTTSPEAIATIRRLDSFYHVQVRAGFNGSVLIGYQGRVLYERYFGYCNKEEDIALCAQSPSQLASTSKPFTATAILWLHQNRYLNIDDPVKKYLKDFPYPDITVKMLLDQRSGLPDYLHFATNYWKNAPIKSNEDLYQLFIKVKPRLEFKPNARFKYSNSNYALLARVLEEVTEMSYPKFMKEFIFEPLGMTQTFVYDPQGPKPEKIAISYKYNWRREPDMFADGIYGDKNIYSTVRDMYRWDQSFYHHALLNEKTLRMAYAGYSPDMRGVKDYGLGWRMMDFPDGYKIVYHNGWWHGNNTVFYRFIQDNFTIIVLGNKYNNNIYRQARAIYNIVQHTAGERSGPEWEEGE